MKFELIFFSIISLFTQSVLSVELTNSTEITVTNSTSTSSSRKLSRRRRYVVFPEGSSFSVAVCMTIGIYGNPNYQLISWALNWGVAYDLPNETLSATTNRNKADMPKPVVQRRYRRDLYSKLELAMNDMGYDGRDCILRAICESPQYFKSKGSNMIEELLRTIFSLPKTKVLPFEHEDTIHYDNAHRRGVSNSFCPSLFSKCGFSLLDLALGHYSKPDNLNFM